MPAFKILFVSFPSHLVSRKSRCLLPVAAEVSHHVQKVQWVKYSDYNPEDATGQSTEPQYKPDSPSGWTHHPQKPALAKHELLWWWVLLWIDPSPCHSQSTLLLVSGTSGSLPSQTHVETGPTCKACFHGGWSWAFATMHCQKDEGQIMLIGVHIKKRKWLQIIA